MSARPGPGGGYRATGIPTAISLILKLSRSWGLANPSPFSKMGSTDVQKPDTPLLAEPGIQIHFCPRQDLDFPLPIGVAGHFHGHLIGPGLQSENCGRGADEAAVQKNICATRVGRDS